MVASIPPAMGTALLPGCSAAMRHLQGKMADGQTRMPAGQVRHAHTKPMGRVSGFEGAPSLKLVSRNLSRARESVAFHCDQHHNGWTVRSRSPRVSLEQLVNSLGSVACARARQQAD